MEYNRKSLSPHFEVGEELKVRGSPDHIQGKPQKDKFHTAPWVWLAKLYW